MARTSTIGGTAGGGTIAITNGSVGAGNAVFTFASAPSVITVDDVPKQKMSSDGTVNWTGTTTVTLTVAPTFDIFGI